MVGCSFCWQAGEAYYLPLRAPAGEPQLDPRAALDALREVLENPAVKKVGQNLKYDMIVLQSAGIKMAGAEFDTMIASYLLDAGERNHSLDELVEALSESYDDQDQRVDRQRQKPEADGRSAGRARHGLCGRGCRRDLAAAADPGGAAARDRICSNCSTRWRCR